jgi:hypothetical protein
VSIVCHSIGLMARMMETGILPVRPVEREN